MGVGAAVGGAVAGVPGALTGMQVGIAVGAVGGAVYGGIVGCTSIAETDDKHQAPLLIPVLKIAPEATRPILRAVEERMLPGAIKKR